MNLYKTLCQIVGECFSALHLLYTLAWFGIWLTLSTLLFYPESIFASIATEVLVGCVVFVLFSRNRFKLKSNWSTSHWVVAYLVPGFSVVLLILVAALLTGIMRQKTIRIMGNGDAQYGKTDEERDAVLSYIEKRSEMPNKKLNLQLAHDYQTIKNEESSNSQDGKHPLPSIDSSVNVNLVWQAIESSRAKERPHIIELDLVWIKPLVEEGFLLPLDSHIKPTSKFYSFGVSDAVALHSPPKRNVDSESLWLKREYAVPFFLNVGFLMYRKDLLLDPSEVPATWEQWITEIQAIKQERGNHIHGFVFQGADYEGLMCSFMEMLWAMGGHIPVTEEGIPQVANDGLKVKETFDWYQQAILLDIIPREVLSLNETESERMFLEEDVIIHRNWPRTLDRILNKRENAVRRGQVDVYDEPIPAFNNVPGGSPKMCLGGWAFAVTKYAEEDGVVKESVRVIEALTSAEWFEAMVRSLQLNQNFDAYSIRVPANEDIVRRRVVDNLAVNVSYELLKDRNYRSRPQVDHYVQFSGLLTRSLHNFMQECFNNKVDGRVISTGDIQRRLEALQLEINRLYEE